VPAERHALGWHLLEDVVKMGRAMLLKLHVGGDQLLKLDADVLEPERFAEMVDDESLSGSWRASLSSLREKCETA
jgi:hypothetical protein